MDLKRICICSGSRKLDISRAKTAIDFRKGLESKVPIRILGAGPDLKIALREHDLFLKRGTTIKSYFEKLKGLDHHLGLYLKILKETGEEPEVITKSTTLVQNILYGFPEDREGMFGVVTEPWHYQKFKTIQNVLERKGKISGGLYFFNIPSPDTGEYNLLQRFLSRIKSKVELMKI